MLDVGPAKPLAVSARRRGILSTVWIWVAVASPLLALSVVLYLGKEMELVNGTRTEAPAGSERPVPAVTLSGTVISAHPDYFLLDTGRGRLVVEVDDSSDLYREGQMLRARDQVTVTGYPDGRGRLEAGRVVIQGLEQNVHANPRDEEAE